MAKHTTVFSQVLRMVPKTLFDSLATKHQVNKGVRTFTAHTQFSSLLLAQLQGLMSLREIEHATRLAALQGQGLRPARRSTLADANRRISWTFYQDLFFQLLPIYSRLFSRHEFDLPGKLFSLDVTSISVPFSLFPWAHFRARKGAMRLHTLLDHDGHIPSTIVVTHGLVHEIRVARALPFKSGDTLLFDRAYSDSAWFHTLTRNGVGFVTRIPPRTAYTWHEERHVDRRTGLRYDRIGHLSGARSRKCPDPLRLIEYRDPKTKQTIEFLTNLLDHDPMVIVDLYRQRWQIELFFKWIKQHLKIKTFFGTDENAVLTQIWVAMIAYLLLRVIQREAKQAISTHHLLIAMASQLHARIPVSMVWQDVQRTKRRTNTYRKQQLIPALK